MNRTWVLYGVSFISNAVILIFEITGGRLLAPYLGTSVEVWAGLIGIVLGGMAVGYALGGFMGDKNSSRTVISGFLFAAGAAALIAWSIRDAVPTVFLLSDFPLTLNTLLVGVILFVPTVILLAAVSPLIAKNLLRELDTSARTVGILNMVGTLGSIFGAVVTGLVLIPSFGVSSILLGIAVVLFVLAVSIEVPHIMKGTLFGVFVVALALLLNSMPTRAAVTLADISTAYNRIWVDSFTDNDIPIRTISIDPFGTQCAMYENDDGSVDEHRLVFEYIKAFDVVARETLKKTEAPKALFLGGCNYSYPRAFLGEFPEGNADVVEIDPGMTAVAKEYFDFDHARFPSLKIFHEDARMFFNTTRGAQYDIVFMDTFGSASNIPSHLTTKEFFTDMRANVAEDGVVVVNVIGAVEGKKAAFALALLKTVQQVFPNTALYTFSAEPGTLQNLLLIASPARDLANIIVSPAYPDVVLQKMPSSMEASLILTDNYAPVERFTSLYR